VADPAKRLKNLKKKMKAVDTLQVTVIVMLNRY